MRFTDYVWDYDGTLFDTYDAVCRSYMRAVRDKGIDISWEELRWMSKHSLGWAAQQLEARYHVSANELLALREYLVHGAVQPKTGISKAEIRSIALLCGLA